MDKTIFEDMEKYLEQLQDFLQSTKDSAQLTIRADKTGDEDRFVINYDRNTIGSLILMLASDETLGMLAQFALIHMMSLRSEAKIEKHFKKLSELSKELRREVSGDRIFRFAVLRNQQPS